MASDERESLRMLFFPFMSPGHMLPMVDMAKLFAGRGVTATIFTTPANVPIIQSSITRTDDNPTHPNYRPIQLLSVPFPSPAATGLPDGCENVTSLPSPDMESGFINSVSMLRQQFGRALRDLHPDCVVTDMFLPWTHAAAAELGVPRIVFHGCNFFSLCASAALDRHRTLELLPEDASSFTVPGIPHRIEMTRSQMPNYKNWDPDFVEIFDRIQDSVSKSYGVAVNSFYELEPEYARYYRDVVGQKAWHVGPLALTNQNNNYERAGRGVQGVDHDSCDYITGWLDSKAPGSVLYVCFGSISYSSEAELRQLALGLEASGRPFVWVVRKDVGGWIPDGFGGRGLVVRGWAPQILILDHPAIGGFLTHCGWNSCLEGITAGLPLVTWPLSADQFYNERFVVDVLRIGVGVGATRYGMDPEERMVVGAVEIESAVSRVMGGGEEAEERRRRAKEMAMAAKSAAAEGGSSYVDVGNLMKELMETRQITE